MLSISGISKAYAGRRLFEDVSLQVNRGDRIGLVGSNGAGKSTLFSLILGLESPDEGKIQLDRSITIGHLPQETIPLGQETVWDLAVAPRLSAADLSGQPSLLHAESVGRAGAEALHSRFDEPGGGELIPKARRMLQGLGFREEDFQRPVRELSGGWIMRAHLGRLLTQEPDLLLLDEPTNHFDLESLQWFQDHLKTYRGGILAISHDREFLDQVVGTIVEIRHGRFFRYRGNYEDYLAQREANEAQILAAYKNQQREIERLMTFVERFRAKNTKAAQAQSKLKQIDRMELIEAPEGGEAAVEFTFPQPPRTGLKVIRLTDVHHAYGERVIYRGLNFEAERGQRIVLVGPNGAGKSTLLKILAGVLPFQSGERTPGLRVNTGYYSQHRLDVLHPDWTVLAEALDTPSAVTEVFVRSVLGAFLFRGDDVFKQVSVLSGGEKSRLALVKLLLNPPNLLLMDEPTTHLDLASVEALIAALEQFEGTLIFISHDAYFIRRIANHVVHVQHGRLTHYPGDYQYYLDKTAPLRAAAAAAAAKETAQSGEADGAAALSRKEQKRLEAEERQARSRERRRRQKIVDDLEKQIAGLETRQAELTAEMESPATYQMPGRAAEINIELARILKALPRLHADWETAATAVMELETE